MIFFRADMNETIATGHIMRCLSIADAAREAGEESCFIVADENACNLLKERGYKYIVLHSEWDNLDAEISTMVDLIIKEHIGVLLVDSYKVTHRYLETLNKHTKVVYLDDLYEEAYPVSAVINYDACEDKDTYFKRYEGTDTKVYYGYEYAPLRKEFAGLKHEPFNEKGEQRLLILSGGSDPEHFIKSILKEINISEFKKIYAICGRYNLDYVELLKTYMDSDIVEIHQNVSNLWEYMIKSDICISAAGNTAYELMAAGTPTILYTLSKEQVPAAKAISHSTPFEYSGSLDENETYLSIVSMVKVFISDSNRLNSVSKIVQTRVDGFGSKRITGILRAMK